ncbi:unnamed protein product, partial [Brassica rapa subsp. trilocularis]
WRRPLKLRRQELMQTYHLALATWLTDEKQATTPDPSWPCLN